MSFIIRFSDDCPRIKYFLEILSAEENKSTGDLTLLNYYKQINSYLQITYKVIDL